MPSVTLRDPPQVRRADIVNELLKAQIALRIECSNAGLSCLESRGDSSLLENSQREESEGWWRGEEGWRREKGEERAAACRDNVARFFALLSC